MAERWGNCSNCGGSGEIRNNNTVELCKVCNGDGSRGFYRDSPDYAEKQKDLDKEHRDILKAWGL